MSPNSHSIIVIEEDIELRIPLRLDGIFSYFSTRSLTPEEIKNIDNVEAIFLTPYVTSWDTYDDTYEDEEDNFLDQQGDMIYPQQQKIKLFNDQYFCKITMSE